MKNLERVAVADLHTMLATMINRAYYAGERTIITRRGEEYAAIISIQDLKALEGMEEPEKGKKK